MKHLIQWVLAATLICGTSMFTACTSDNGDNPVKPIDNLAEKIIGKWMMNNMNSQPLPTNQKGVFTFTSGTQAYMSASILAHYAQTSDLWSIRTEYTVEINGNKVKLTNVIDEHSTRVVELNVSSINAADLKATMKNTLITDGVETSSPAMNIDFVKVDVDYTSNIVGLWEGKCTSQGSVFDDGQPHRWEYKADGNYVYYKKDTEGNWVVVDNPVNQYFVDGNLLFTRWIDNEQDNREWWETSIDGNTMKWTALRANADGTTFIATFEMTKITE